jgi:uncharacterized membrane protein
MGLLKFFKTIMFSPFVLSSFVFTKQGREDMNLIILCLLMSKENLNLTPKQVFIIWILLVCLFYTIIAILTLSLTRWVLEWLKCIL